MQLLNAYLGRTVSLSSWHKKVRKLDVLASQEERINFKVRPSKQLIRFEIQGLTAKKGKKKELQKVQGVRFPLPKSP